MTLILIVPSVILFSLKSLKILTKLGSYGFIPILACMIFIVYLGV